MMVGTKVELLERVLDTYIEIGELIPDLKDYEDLFRDCSRSREILEWYLMDILRFHAEVLKVFSKSCEAQFIYLYLYHGRPLTVG